MCPAFNLQYFDSVLISLAYRLRKETGDEKYWAPLDRREGSLAHAIMVSCYTPFSTSPRHHHYGKPLIFAQSCFFTIAWHCSSTRGTLF